MDGHTDLLGISAFARRVGLTPSALRFYDDCRVLRPAHVDPVTGYRYYAPDQERRGRSLRTLREAGVPLAEAAVVLDSSRTEAVAVLERHRRRTRERTRVAEAALDELLAAVTGAGPGGGGAGGRGTEPVGPDRPPPDPGGTTRVRLDGLELAGAVRQVVPSVERTGEHPVLGCVLIEVGGAGGVGDDRNGEAGEVRFVATDRYRLAVRSLVPRGLSGPRRAPWWNWPPARCEPTPWSWCSPPPIVTECSSGACRGRRACRWGRGSTPTTGWCSTGSVRPGTVSSPTARRCSPPCATGRAPPGSS
ncbi:MerR family transcriptional regulator [Streptomyces alkaliphilus]|uniref:MerR family transcriptional regulator n=1 Tax=Streptomyces alkaliphilus TaxID=1472722 RepID=UPI001E49532F|nr:MerR family transcriptional regulator [Streptomyces alkaliphilus]